MPSRNSRLHIGEEGKKEKKTKKTFRRRVIGGNSIIGKGKEVVARKKIRECCKDLKVLFGLGRLQFVKNQTPEVC